MASSFYFDSTTYWSRRDEDAHFAWLASIGCVCGVRGEGRRLLLDIDVERISGEDLRELTAVYRRYGGDLCQLEGLHPSRSPAKAGVQIGDGAGSRPSPGHDGLEGSIG